MKMKGRDQISLSVLCNGDETNVLAWVNIHKPRDKHPRTLNLGFFLVGAVPAEGSKVRAYFKGRHDGLRRPIEFNSFSTREGSGQERSRHGKDKEIH